MSNKQDAWKMISKNYAKLEADIKDEIDGLDNADKGEENRNMLMMMKKSRIIKIL